MNHTTVYVIICVILAHLLSYEMPQRATQEDGMQLLLYIHTYMDEHVSVST